MAEKLTAWPYGKSIVLVGLMGAGKTAVGRRLAAEIGLSFVDADAEIEKAAGRTINEIFEELGENAFRDGERRVIARLLAGPPQVLATGGGAYMNDATRAAIKKRAVSIWLRADLDTLFARVSRRDSRPLLRRADPKAVLADLMKVRSPVYAEADIHVDSLETPVTVTVDRVISALSAFAEENLAHNGHPQTSARG